MENHLDKSLALPPVGHQKHAIWDVCCVVVVVKDSVFSLGVLEYVCVRGVMDVVFFICIVTRGAENHKLVDKLKRRRSDGKM